MIKSINRICASLLILKKMSVGGKALYCHQKLGPSGTKRQISHVFAYLWYQGKKKKMTVEGVLPDKRKGTW